MQFVLLDTRMVALTGRHIVKQTDGHHYKNNMSPQGAPTLSGRNMIKPCQTHKYASSVCPNYPRRSVGTQVSVCKYSYTSPVGKVCTLSLGFRSSKWQDKDIDNPPIKHFEFIRVDTTKCSYTRIGFLKPSDVLVIFLFFVYVLLNTSPLWPFLLEIWKFAGEFGLLRHKTDRFSS